jgi:hypothetical protein
LLACAQTWFAGVFAIAIERELLATCQYPAVSISFGLVHQRAKPRAAPRSVGTTCQLTGAKRRRRC